ncbi:MULTISPECIES: hypothetical protein [Bacillati]|uniref:hypothetical protein n=1 Tax=Bacillati TaxID=1783272 RepID=UPI003419187E
MLSDLLWLYGAKRQYDIQKEAGLAGLIGVVATLFIIMQWDNLFFPFFNTIGLVELVNEAGLVDKTFRETFLNIAFTALFFIFSLGVLMAAPMLILMLIFSVVGKDSSKPNPFLFALGLFFLPVMFIIYVFYKLLQFIGIVKADPMSVEKYTKQNSEMRNVLTQSIGKNLDSELLQLLTIQEQQKGISTSYRVLTLEEAVITINRAISSLKENDEFLFAYDEKYKSWYLLFPNPIPVFASEALLDSKPEVTPFNFEKLSKAQLAFSTGSIQAIKPLFYAPALPVSITFDATNKITMSLVANHNGFVACLDKLTKLVKVNGSIANQIYEDAIKNVGINELITKAHSYAYVIPLAYPEEVQMFNDPSCTFSYYKALQEVPNTTKYCELYKANVLKTVSNKAAAGHLWAKNLLEHSNNNVKVEKSLDTLSRNVRF